MILLNLLRFVRGYVRFELEGIETAKFINLCAGENVSIWGLKKINGIFYGYTYYKSFEKAQKLGKRCNMSLKVLKTGGLPYHYKKHKKRTGAFIGAAIFLLFIAGTQKFIWTVEVSGNETITTRQLLDAASEVGIRFGAYKPSVNFEAAESYLLSRFDTISWVAVNQMGTKVHIEISEGDKAPEIVSENDFCNIVAAKDGVITKTVVYCGQKVVSKGDAVVAGDLLINGIMEDKKGNNLFTCAAGEIFAETEFEKEFRVKLNIKEKKFDDNYKTKYALKMGEMALPLYFGKPKSNTEWVKVDKSINIFGIKLPIEVELLNYNSYKEEEVTISDATAIKVAKYKRSLYERDELAKAKILSAKESFKKKDGELIYTVLYRCNENIAKKEKIYFTAKKS